MTPSRKSKSGLTGRDDLLPRLVAGMAEYTWRLERQERDADGNPDGREWEELTDQERKYRVCRQFMSLEWLENNIPGVREAVDAASQASRQASDVSTSPSDSGKIPASPTLPKA